MRLRGDGASTSLRLRFRLRFRVAARWSIAILAALDVAGAAYLRELWNERHPELSGAGERQVASPNASDSQRAAPGPRITSTR